MSIPVITETPKNPEVDKPSKDVLDFYFTPSVDEKVVHENGQKIIDFLTGETGYNFQLHVTKNYDDMIAAFGTGSADIGIMNSLSYIKAREDFGVTAKLRAIRYGKSTYFGQIVTNASRGIKSLKDLEGKTIAYTDRSSTSGYLFPQRIIKNAGVKPGKIVFAGKHDTVVKMVYEGIADAGATFYSEPTSTGTIRDARARLIDKYPDVEEKVKILTITNPIPNDPVVFAKDLPTEMSYKISLGLIKYLLTEEGKKTMMELYSTDGFMRCSDADYDELRQAVLE
ncbi:MAG: phosphate/phosphite/phosphonate ABC transporter substrate-binding protein [Bacteroidales bacterium]|nr:phosphate/phosphite/phosphonate ABC transporter substrate-binding protein [Bacteroidales bacterium]